MNFAFFSVFIVILILIIVFVVFRRITSNDPGRSYKPVDVAVRHERHVAARQPDQVHSTESQKRIVFESYPALKDIPYSSMPEGVYPVSLQEIDEKIVKRVGERVSSIKPMPVNYFKLLNMLRNPESNPGEITSIVMTNPVFSAKILQAVNSAYFKRADKITSVGRAITLLGYNNVRTLVFQDALDSVVTREQYGDVDSYSRAWIHAAVVSACSGHLGKSVFQCSEYELGAIGLLHDIGKYFINMLEQSPETADDLPVLIKEERRYGINHAQLGSLIAARWQLPEPIQKGIEYHHYPSYLAPESIPENYRKQGFAICLSDLICKAMGFAGNENEILSIRNEYYEVFKLNRDLSEIITTGLIKEIEKARFTVESYVSATLT